MVSNINIFRSFSVIMHSWALLPFRNNYYFQISISLAFLYLLSHKFSGCIFQFLWLLLTSSLSAGLQGFSSLLVTLLRFPSVFNLFCIHFAMFWDAFVICPETGTDRWSLGKWDTQKIVVTSVWWTINNKKKRQTISSII